MSPLDSKVWLHNIVGYFPSLKTKQLSNMLRYIQGWMKGQSKFYFFYDYFYFIITLYLTLWCGRKKCASDYFVADEQAEFHIISLLVLSFLTNELWKIICKVILGYLQIFISPAFIGNLNYMYLYFLDKVKWVSCRARSCISIREKAQM